MIDPRRIEVIDDVTAKIYRGMTPMRKLELLDGMYEFCRTIMGAGVRASHPEWSDSQVEAEVLRRIRGSHKSGDAA